MDEIEQRLRTATDACISSYDAWRSNQKQDGTRETLMEAVHELRKIAARLEIEIAVSERDEMAAKPIPIPPHRASRKQNYNNGDVLAEDNVGNMADNVGNTASGHGGSHTGGFRDHGGGHRSGGGGGGNNNPRRRRMSVGGGHGGGGQGGGGGGGNGNGPQGGGGNRDGQS